VNISFIYYPERPTELHETIWSVTHMSISISINETVSGITAGISFSISPRALRHEIGDETWPSEISDTPEELIEELNRAVLSEARILLDEARQKLHLCLVSSLTDHFQNALHRKPQGDAQEKSKRRSIHRNVGAF